MEHRTDCRGALTEFFNTSTLHTHTASLAVLQSLQVHAPARLCTAGQTRSLEGSVWRYSTSNNPKCLAVFLRF